jgi:RHS repeat-associated protein
MSGRIAGIVLWLVAAVATSAQAQTVEYLHTDALGSVVAVTDANRNVIERREYEPYGSQLTPAVSNGPGYTGHVQDAATGLVYMQQRYYDAQLGRFLSMDPVTANSGTGANFNRYWYADNNPYTFIDPTGRCTGSRIENKDSTCRSTGGNTTETYGARQGEGRSTAGGADGLSDQRILLASLAPLTNTLEAGIQRAILRGDAGELRTLLGRAHLRACRRSSLETRCGPCVGKFRA